MCSTNCHMCMVLEKRGTGYCSSFARKPLRVTSDSTTTPSLGSLLGKKTPDIVTAPWTTNFGFFPMQSNKIPRSRECPANKIPHIALYNAAAVRSYFCKQTACFCSSLCQRGSVSPLLSERESQPPDARMKYGLYMSLRYIFATMCIFNLVL